MNKFLQISGVIFWIQLIVIGIYAAMMMLSASEYEDELAEFASSLETNILDKRDWNKSSKYFKDSITQENSFSTFIEALNLAGNENA